MKILVVGAGIAGSAAAHMLAFDGHDVQLVDSAKGPPSGGYQIMLDETALEVLRLIGAGGVAEGIGDAAAEISVIRRGKKLTDFSAPGYLMARRGDLIGAIARFADQSVPVAYNRALEGIEQRGTGAIAHFSDGAQEQYDLIIGADGLRSTVRRLAMEDRKPHIYTNGRLCHWVNVPGRIDGARQAAILTGQGASALVFPYPGQDETLIVTGLKTAASHRRPGELAPEVVKLLRGSGERYAAFAEDVAGTPEEDTRVTRFAQVRAPKWHARNVVLLGDAAHCIDPLSGAGGHGALLGAAIFAQELRWAPNDPYQAATRYESRVRPFTTAAQRLTSGLFELSTASTVRGMLSATRALAISALSTRKVPIPDYSYVQTRVRKTA